jgi:RNA-directed DNA polymerase
LRLIRKWLKAGVIENGVRSETVVGAAQGASASPLLSNVYLHYVFDLWADQWRRRHARGDVIITRFADDYIVGFEHREDAQRFLDDLRGRLAKFNLELAPEKTRLIEFGRFAARNRARRGQGKPETFRFLGFTHICAKATNGSFLIKRITDSTRARAKLRAVKAEMRRRAHQPIPEQGEWLASVVRGHYAYYAVPGNIKATDAFRDQVTRHWHKALRRRSQRTRLNWERMHRLTKRWLPPAKIMHPWPDARFDARTQARSPVR